MKKLLFKLLIPLFVMLLLISSGTALFIQFTGSSFDPIEAIQTLQSQNRKDDALDLVRFYEENDNLEPEKIKILKNQLEYSLTEKIRSIADGAFTGDVYDTYSGIGAIASDLTLYGDIRDLGIQSWRYLKDENPDSIIAVLSGVGIILSSRPILDSMASISKTTIKYINNVRGIDTNKGILKKMLKGDLNLKASKQVIGLLKKRLVHTQDSFNPIQCS